MTLSSLRARWVTLVGTFVALALGVALIATMGLALASTFDAPPQQPARLAGAPVVVRGADELRVPTRGGDRVKPLAQPSAVPPALATELSRVAPAVADRSFPVHVDLSALTPTSPPTRTTPSSPAAPPVSARAEPLVLVGTGADGDLVGHPWSVARFGGHRVVAGHEPRRHDEIVLVADRAAVGGTIRVRTPAGSGDYTVAGILAQVPFERAVFFTDGTAAALSPRIDNLVVDTAPDAVRAIVSGFPGVQVLTGDDRRRADPDPDRDSDALVAMNALLGTAGGVTTFVSVFVVASTFAFAVAQRRREIGLLRTAGATPRQIRRMVFAEAVVVGAVASAAGCVLGSRGAPWLARLLVGERLAPAWFTIGDHRWPYHVAFWTGLLVALAGVTVATVRAGRIRPTEALREASVDSRAMTAGRWIFGIGILAIGLGLCCWRLLTDPGEALHRKTYTTQPMLLITAVALLAPVLAGPLARLVAWLPARMSGATGMLIRENASAGLRRTAAVAAPVLITVALAGSLLGTTATISEAKAEELRTRTTADLIIPGALDDRTVAAVRAVAGAQVMTSAATAVYTVEDGVALVRSQALAVDPQSLTAVRRLPVTAGDVADLDDDSIIVNEEWATHGVGDRVDVWLGDGTPRSLRIVAVLATGTGSNGVYVTTRNAGGAHPDLLELSWLPGTDTRAAETTVRNLLSPSPTAEAGPAPVTATGARAPSPSAEARPGRTTAPRAVAPSPPTGADGGPNTTSGGLEPSGEPDAIAHGGGGAAHDRLTPAGVQVLTRDQWLAEQSPVVSRQTRVGYIVVLGIALLYTGIAVANTMVMATSDRTRELAVLRLAGATKRQVLLLVAAEALTVVLVGTVLGLIVTAMNLFGIWTALAVLSVWSAIVVPWLSVAATLAACAVVAVVAAVLPAIGALRTRPAELAGTHE
ncbi:FtsX-like permease family protein [Actinoplanes xinjiangensis]|uniref:FtsX-like permease family protein n=1 Tax=Actinoplanes xinjiangensis TaxID=512350 RepID=UPI003424CB6E